MRGGALLGVRPRHPRQDPRDEQRDGAGGDRGDRLLPPDGGRGAEIQARRGPHRPRAQLALERDAGVDGVAVEQIVGVVAQAGAREVGHPGVEPAGRGHGGAEPGERDPGRRRGRRGRRRRLEGAGAGDERLEIGGGAIPPVADVLSDRRVGALDGPQIEHRLTAAGERVRGGGIGRGSDVEIAVEPHDLPRGGDEGQTEDDEQKRPDDACRHPNLDAAVL